MIGPVRCRLRVARSSSPDLNPVRVTCLPCWSFPERMNVPGPSPIMQLFSQIAAARISTSRPTVPPVNSASTLRYRSDLGSTQVVVELGDAPERLVGCSFQVEVIRPQGLSSRLWLVLIGISAVWIERTSTLGIAQTRCWIGCQKCSGSSEKNDCTFEPTRVTSGARTVKLTSASPATTSPRAGGGAPRPATSLRAASRPPESRGAATAGSPSAGRAQASRRRCCRRSASGRAR